MMSASNEFMIDGNEINKQLEALKMEAYSPTLELHHQLMGQVFGGFGYSLLSPVARHLCDSRVARIYEGTDEIMELKIASLVLGKGFEAYS